MSNGHESAQSRRALRQSRAVSDEDQPLPDEASETGTNQAPVDAEQSAEISSPDDAQPRERRSRRAADVPVDAPSSTERERVSQVRARDRETLRSYRALADKQPEQEAGIPTRRQLRLQQQAAAGHQTQPGAVLPVPPASPLLAAPPVDKTQLTVEQALAAREAIIGQAQNQVAMMEAAAKDDPFSVDLEILAQQKALAERAAILNTRAQKIQQLTQENRQRKPVLNDPTTAHNLSIVSPVEFIQVGKAEDSSSPAPSTSHIPVVRPAVPRQRPVAGVLAPAVIPGPGAGTDDGVQPAVTASPVSSGEDLSALSPDSAGRSRVLAQAEAMALGPRRHGSDDASPVRARSAYGLEPLDAMTAGLARVQRMRIVQYSVLGLGALALITGIMMIVGGFGG